MKKNAINEALPKTKQIVDRFHIFKNLTDDLNDYIKRTLADTIIFTPISAITYYFSNKLLNCKL